MQFLLRHPLMASNFEKSYQLRVGSTDILKLLTIRHKRLHPQRCFWQLFRFFLHTQNCN